MNRLTDNDRNWGPFTLARWKNRIGIAFNTGDEEEDELRNSLLIIAFGWALRIKLPNLVQPMRIRHEANWDEETQKRLGRNYYFETYEREWGVFLSSLDEKWDSLSVRYGPQTNDSSTTKSWFKTLPWTQWDHVRHSFYTPTGEHFYTAPKGTDWKTRHAKEDECPVTHFAFKDYDGEHRIATCRIEEREWRRGTGWFKWLRLLYKPMIRRSLDLQFDYEIGKGKGSWKGGTIGHGTEMQAGDSPESAFRRYCITVHNSRNGNFTLQYVGPSGPPEPKDIRVARNRGWTQNADDKDLWMHPKGGRWCSTKSMLEDLHKDDPIPCANAGTIVAS